MSQATQAIPAARETRLVDAQNPWPGLAAFGEADSEFFGGRAAESRALLERILREELTILFGVSGLGKSSLLRAGVFSKLRDKGVLPIYIRLDYSSDRPAFGEQVRSEIASAAERAEVEAPIGRDGDTLWEFFHRRGSDFWSSRNRPVTPLLVFDQFEEIFTLGRSSAGRRAATEALIEELSDLIEGRPPEAVRMQLAESPQAAEEYEFRRHRYKVLLSLREDYLAPLETLRGSAPSIGHNRVRLERMNGVAAMEVASIAPDIMEADVAESVVRFLAATSARDGEDTAKRLPLADLEIEPALLSVVCRELNNSRKDLGHSKITEALLEGSADEILADVYERAVDDLGPDVRTFVEEQLLTLSGYRDSCALENALDAPGMSEEVIDELVNRRLLRLEARDGMRRVELTHDLLSGVIARSREKRRFQERQRQALEERRQKEAVERQDRIKARRVQRQRALAITVPILVSLLVFAVIGIWIGYEGKAEAEIERDKAHKAAANAIEQQQIAEVRKLTVESSINLEGSPQRGLLLAMESVRLSQEVEGPVIFEAQSALLRALAQTSGRPLYQEGAQLLAFSPTQADRVAASDGEFIRLFDLARPDREPVAFRAGTISALRFAEDGETLMAVTHPVGGDGRANFAEAVSVDRWSLEGKHVGTHSKSEVGRLIEERLQAKQFGSTGVAEFAGVTLAYSGSSLAILAPDGVRLHRGLSETSADLKKRIGRLEKDDGLEDKVRRMQADWVARESGEIDMGPWYHQGPIPSRGSRLALARVFPPEKSAWEFDGDDSAWERLRDEPRLSQEQNGVDYFLRVFEIERPVRMRLAVGPQCSVWVNQERFDIDMNRARRGNTIEFDLRPGTNRILLKYISGRGRRLIFHPERVVPYALRSAAVYRHKSPRRDEELRALFLEEALASESVFTPEERQVLWDLSDLKSRLAIAEKREEITKELGRIEELRTRMAAFQAPTAEYRESFDEWRAQLEPNEKRVWVSESMGDAGYLNHEVWTLGQLGSPKVREAGWPAWGDHEGERGRLQESPGKDLAQHNLMRMTSDIVVPQGGRIFTRVWIDPEAPPSAVMLQYSSDQGWSHRAFWGSEEGMPWGKVGTTTLQHLGPLPPKGQWVTLEVDPHDVGLEAGSLVNGLGFSQIEGRVWWGEAGLLFPPALDEVLASGASSAEAEALLWKWYAPRLPAYRRARNELREHEGSLLQRIGSWAGSGSGPMQPRVGHFTSIGLGADGRYLVGATSAGALTVWDLSGWSDALDPPMPTVLPHPAGVAAVAVDPSGSSFACGGADGVVRLWSLDDLTAPSGELRGQESAIQGLGFTRSGLLVAASRDSIRFWDLRNPWQGTPRLLHDSSIRAVQFDADGCTLATGTESGEVSVWEMRDFLDEAGSVATRSSETREALHRALGPPPGGPVTSVAFSSDGKVLAAGSPEKVSLWFSDVAHDWKEETFDFTGLPFGSRSVAFTSPVGLATGGPLDYEQWFSRLGVPDSQPEITTVLEGLERARESAAEADETEVVIHTRTSKAEADRKGEEKQVLAEIAEFSKKKTKTGSAPPPEGWGVYRPEGLRRPAVLPRYFFFRVEIKAATICEVPNPGSGLSIWVDGKRVHYSNSDEEDPHASFTLKGPGERGVLVHAELDPRSHGSPYLFRPRFISESDQLQRMAEHLADWREHMPRMLRDEDASLARFRGSPYPAVSGLAQQLTDQLPAFEKPFSKAHSSVALWNLTVLRNGTYGDPRWLQGGPGAPIRLAADSNMLVTDTGNAICVWDVEAGAQSVLHADLLQTGERVTAIAITSRWLAVALSSERGDTGNLIRLVSRDETELDPSANMIELSGHDGLIHSLVFDQAGELLASGSADRTARIWAVNDPTREPIELPRETSEVLAVAFSPDDEWLAVAGLDGSVRLWPLRLDALLRIARGRVGRDLTQAEWRRYLGDRPYRQTSQAAGL